MYYKQTRPAFCFMLLMVVVMGFSISSCVKDITVIELPGANLPTETELSFTDSIVPIFQTKCVRCHTTGGRAPDVTPANAYSSLMNGGYVVAKDPDNSLLMKWLTGQEARPMPTSGPDDALNALVYTWIKQGAKNN